MRSTAKMVMAALALAGITGLYLRQVRQTRVLGLVGYLVFGAGYLLMLSTEAIAAFVLPGLAHSSPGYVNNVVVAAFGGTPTHSIGGIGTLFVIAGLAYLVGGLLFGIALFRARVLSRWAVGAPRCGRRLDRRPEGAAAVVQPPDGCSDGCRPHRPRHLPVA